MLFFTRSAITAVLLGLLSVPAWAGVAGKVSAVRGDIIVQRGGSSQTLSVSDPVNQGDKITAGDDASAKITLDSGPVLQLTAGSSITISTASPATRITRIKMWVGKLWARMSSGNNASFEVETSSAVAGVRGTAFSCEVDSNGRTRIEVTEGQVEMTSTATGDVVRLARGRAGQITDDGTIEEGEASNAPNPLAGGTGAPEKRQDSIDQVSDADKSGSASSAVARMKAILAKVIGHLKDARDQRDVVKLNCVNEKLTAVKGLLKVSEQADVTLQEALARRDTEVSAHEYEKIIIAQRKCEQLLAESEACVGELAVYSGDTQIEVELTGVPEQDPLDEKPDLVPVVPESPAPASGFAP